MPVAAGADQADHVANATNTAPTPASKTLSIMTTPPRKEPEDATCAEPAAAPAPPGASPSTRWRIAANAVVGSASATPPAAKRPVGSVARNWSKPRCKRMRTAPAERPSSRAISCAAKPCTRCRSSVARYGSSSLASACRSVATASRSAATSAGSRTRLRAASRSRLGSNRAGSGARAARRRCSRTRLPSMPSNHGTNGRDASQSCGASSADRNVACTASSARCWSRHKIAATRHNSGATASKTLASHLASPVRRKRSNQRSGRDRNTHFLDRGPRQCHRIGGRFAVAGAHGGAGPVAALHGRRTLKPC